MRKWSINKNNSEIKYISDKGEVIKKVERYESYRPVGQRLATRSHKVKYYYSPQIKNMKFDTLTEIKKYFEKM